ncbi:MAG: peptide chain release factor aRF-1 [archaeon]|nr:peptide chain release factor aRF-1 [archaeon]
MDERKKQELEELVAKLERIKGKHTELITVYIPADYNMIATQKQLEAEKSTAKNIKSRVTQGAVLDALDKIIRFLKDFKKTPKNGLVVFAGDVAEVEGQQDMELWSIEPPIPLKTRLYRCDKEFVLDALKEMLEVDEVYGLLVMDRKEATIGLLEGKRIGTLQKMTSGIPSKVRAGGQSSQRFHRITEGLTKEFYNRIAAEMKKIFYDMPKLKGILIGGPIPTKDEFAEGDYLPTKLKEKIIGIRDIGDSDESGLKELVQKSQDILSQQEIVFEKKLLENFFDTLRGNPDKAVYGYAATKKALEFGAVETLFISKKLDKDITNELEKMADDISSKVEIISVETTEGEQFFNLSGIGAILRFKMQF